MPSKVAVVVLHYGDPAETVECLASVFESDYDPLRVWVVDNDPRNRVDEIIRNQFPKAEYLQNSKNLGYAGGNNAGIRWAIERGAEYVLILNNDAKLARDTVSKLVEAAEQHPSATIIAPKIFDDERRDIINSYGTTLDWFRLRPKVDAHGQPDGPKYAADRLITLVPGSVMLVRRQLFETIGFFNEKLFLIHEDADFCLRNLESGGKNLVVAGAQAFHKQSRALAPLRESAAYYSTRNFLYLAWKHGGIFAKIKVFAGVLLFSVQKILEWILLPKRRAAARGFLRGAWDFQRGVMGPYPGQAREEIRG